MHPRLLVHRYGIGDNQLPAAVLPYLKYDGGIGDFAIRVRPGCPTDGPFEHEQFTLRPADPDWWDSATGRTRPNFRVGPARRARQHRLDLRLDTGLEVAVPVVIHRPFPEGTIVAIRLLREPVGNKLCCWASFVIRC